MNAYWKKGLLYGTVTHMQCMITQSEYCPPPNIHILSPREKERENGTREDREVHGNLFSASLAQAEFFFFGRSCKKERRRQSKVLGSMEKSACFSSSEDKRGGSYLCVERERTCKESTLLWIDHSMKGKLGRKEFVGRHNGRKCGGKVGERRE